MHLAHKRLAVRLCAVYTRIMLNPAPSQDRRSPFSAADSPDTSPAADSSSLSGGPSVVRFVVSVTVRRDRTDTGVTIATPLGVWSCAAYVTGPAYYRESRLADIDHPRAMPKWLTDACEDIAHDASRDGGGAWTVEHDGSGWATAERCGGVVS